MQAQVSYSVTATLPSAALRDAYVAWLRDDHVAKVIAGGAASAEIIVVSEPSLPPRIQTRYRFSDQKSFEEYLSQHAPNLRADGLKRFPPETGVAFERQAGTVILHVQA